MSTKNSYIILILFSLVFLCSCVKTGRSTENSSVVPSESGTNAAAGTSADDSMRDALLLGSMKSGRYRLQGAEKEVYSVQLETDLWFEFFIAAEKLSDSTLRRGPVAVKDGYLHAICRSTNKLFVFRIPDDHTLVFSGDRSNPLTISGRIIKDGDVFIWEEGETVWDAEKK